MLGVPCGRKDGQTDKQADRQDKAESFIAGKISPLCFNSNINIKYNLTQLSIRQLLKCIFNLISQLHVSARPFGAIFRLNFFEKLICTIDNVMFITRSRI